MKNVLITGADGFIGSHLTEYLLNGGYNVKALSYYNSFNSWGWLEDIKDHDRLSIVSGDVRDPWFCKDLVSNVDTIFHLAALIAIPYSYKSPDSYVETNIKGTLNICNAAKDNGNIRLIHTSTSEVYGTARYVPIDEEHPRQPQSPYSASKIGADAMAMSFYHTFGLPLTIVRPFNTYGPRQSARAIIPSVISQALSGKTIIKAGDLNPSRDFNFVTDICKGFFAVADSDKTIGRELNLCTGVEITIRDLIILIGKVLGKNLEPISDKERFRPDNSEVHRLLGNNKLVKELTGWESVVTLEEGLKKAAEWYRVPANLAKFKPDLYNI